MLHLSAAAFSAFEIIQLHCLVLYVAKTVHKIVLRLFMNETASKLRPVERRSCSDMTHVFSTGSVVSFGTTVTLLRDCSGQLHSPQ